MSPLTSSIRMPRFFPRSGGPPNGPGSDLLPLVGGGPYDSAEHDCAPIPIGGPVSRLLEAPPRPRSLRHRPRHRRRPSIGLRGAGLITVVVLIATGAVVWRTGLIDPLFVRVRRQAVAHPVRPSSQPSPGERGVDRPDPDSAGGTLDERADQHRVPRAHHLPGQCQPFLLRRGTGAEKTDRPVALP